MMATQEETAATVDAIHARLVDARVAIRAAIAANQTAPRLPGSAGFHRAMAEADRLLNNVVATLPWTRGTN
jgi:hypothetical protein